MSVNKVECSTYTVSFYINYIDEEERRIMRRLLYVYGITPTGNKSSDKAKLHECEMTQFKAEKNVSNQYITISLEKQKAYLDKLKDNKKTVNQDTNADNMSGAKIKGEQIYQVVLKKSKK